MGSYSTYNRKIGDGYTYYKEYTPNPGGDSPYGEPLLPAIITDDNTFGGTNPSGAELTVEREILDDEISQELAPIQRLVIGESASFKITANAGRMKNLAIASGRAESDIAAISDSLLPRDIPGESLYVGGTIGLDFVALAHEIVNSVSPNLREWLYMPRCQAGEGFGFGFKKNEIRELEMVFNILPALQTLFLIAQGRHALFQIIFEQEEA